MKKVLLFLFLLVLANFLSAQSQIDLEQVFPKDSLILKEIAIRNAQGQEFNYFTITGSLSSEEIEQYFKIPKQIATKYPLQIIHLKNFKNLKNLKAENITGVSAYSISPEEIIHQFFKNGKTGFVEDKEYKARFANFSYCSFYDNIFRIEVSEAKNWDANPALCIIYNKNIPYKQKTEEELQLQAMYNSFFNIGDRQNPVFLKVQKQADSLNLTVDNILKDTLILKPKF